MSSWAVLSVVGEKDIGFFKILLSIQSTIISNLCSRQQGKDFGAQRQRLLYGKQ
ncbi:hypothetical protein [Prochlorococcus sp. MIT 1306]|uniref:hypothetical protein n=1 Tax=Prochlorococcus sp. MIT 1306 TaxID=1799667 RepID=UPI0012E7A180|nr:hypothetical protein [Prochlorococcus sp. MIT 1306]